MAAAHAIGHQTERAVRQDGNATRTFEIESARPHAAGQESGDRAARRDGPGGREESSAIAGLVGG